MGHEDCGPVTEDAFYIVHEPSFGCRIQVVKRLIQEHNRRA
jgi:hypothetical protein